MTDFAALLQPDKGQPARTLHVVHPDDWADWLAHQPPRVRAIAAANRLTGKPGNAAILPGDNAEDWSALLICNEAENSPWRIASRARALPEGRSEEHTSELQSLMRSSYAVFCLKKKNIK